MRPESETELQRLRPFDKSKAVDQLARGLANDFDDLLGVILSYCKILEQQSGLSPATLGMILEIRHAGLSAKTLTQRLLASSQRQDSQSVPLDLNKIVRRMQIILERLAGHNVVLAKTLCPDLGTIQADATQLEQLLLNLVTNAREAMPRGGRLTITTANVEIYEVHALQSSFLGPGQYVMLTLSGMGFGMSRETQAHTSGAFFSTKPIDPNLGLGFSNVADIARRCGGAITVSSHPGHGTTLQIYFASHGPLPVLFEPDPDVPCAEKRKRSCP